MIHILACGTFGEATAKIIAEKVEDVEITTADQEGKFWVGSWPHADLHVVISWRPVPKLCEVLDEMCHAWKVPWFPIILDTPKLQIGPIVVPGEEGCYSCYRRRQIQHSKFGKFIPSIEEFYSQNPSFGPIGYLEVHSQIAACLFIEFLNRIQKNIYKEAGKVFEYNLITSGIDKGKVVGFHGCKRCGSTENQATRSYEKIVEEFDRIFSY
ncbi:MULTISPECIES: TOMM precursor leader peptide-binding protein [Lysinibacillus]|uniref:TOMM precursor leader peptide-binding protein n=1 Tax=Lysinibacillus TaxID=400634 RepID=UPI00237EA9D3|nr:MULTISPECIES: TOMM precursor leader peptide-binding protein [Lysinibacillus]WDU79262.1 TOMM precursor leader peptide-binding protein [Lysinibacillus sp. G01H]